MMSFLSLFVRVIPEPSPVIYSLLNFNFIYLLIQKRFSRPLAISVSFQVTLGKIIPKTGKSQITSPPDGITLDN